MAGGSGSSAQVASPAQRALAVALTAGAILGALAAMGRVSVLLCAAMAASCGLWLAGRLRARTRTLRIFVVAIGILLLHIAEEYATGFQAAFPGLLGYQWSGALFLAYNLVWVGVFAAAAVGVSNEVALASLAVGFCAIGAGVANGVGHVVLALARGGYFPGLLTAPLCFAAGVALLRSIWQRAAQRLDGAAGRALRSSVSVCVDFLFSLLSWPTNPEGGW